VEAQLKMHDFQQAAVDANARTPLIRLDVRHISTGDKRASVIQSVSGVHEFLSKQLTRVPARSLTRITR